MGIDKKTTDIVPAGQYDPTFQSVITPRTKLASNVTLSKFLGSYNDPVVFNNLSSESDRLLLAKQYYLHAEAMKTINSANGSKDFENYRLVVSEGYYRPAPAEVLDKTDGINHLKTKGRAVVYELIGNDGLVDYDKTFEQFKEDYFYYGDENEEEIDLDEIDAEFANSNGETSASAG